MENLTNTSIDALSLTPVWRTKSVISLILCITGLGFNGILILTFLLNRQLWSPFNVYLFNLLFANLLYFTTESGFNIVDNLYMSYWWLNSACCTVYMYGWWVVSLVQLTTHPLIATNRIWALWAPISYRQYHGYEAALGLCVISWLGAHVIGLWGLLADHLYYRDVDSHICQIDTEKVFSQKVWMLVVQFISIAAVVIIILAFPLIIYKERQRKRIRTGNTLVSGTGHAQHAHTDNKGSTNITATQPTATNQTRPKERSNAHKLLLFALTVSVFIFWSPSVFYYAVVPFSGYQNQMVDSVVMIMFNVQSVLDPILFTLTLRNLRNTMIRTVCFWKRC